MIRRRAARGASVTELKGNESFVSSVAVGPGGTFVVSAASDGTSRVWDAGSGVEIAELRGHERYVRDATFARDGRTVATASDDGTVRLWQVPVDAVLRPDSDIAFGAFDRDGRRAVTATADGTIELWDAATGRRTARFRVPGATRIAAAPDAGRVAIVEASGRVRARDPASPDRPVVLASAADEVAALDYSPDARSVALATGRGVIRVLDASGRVLREFRHPELEPLDGVAFSPDGRSIAVTSAAANAVVVFDARSGRQIRRIVSTDDALTTVAFSPDGEQLIAGTPDGASIWDASTGRLRLRLRGHGQVVQTATFSAGGDLVATASFDGEVRVWDAVSGDLLTVLAGSRAAFGGDRFILTTGAGRGARIHPCDPCGRPQALQSRGRDRATRRFTGAQLKAAAGE